MINPCLAIFCDDAAGLEFWAREKLMPLASRGTGCPDHFLRTKTKPMILDLPANATLEQQRTRLVEPHTEYRNDYLAYYESHADESSPATRIRVRVVQGHVTLGL